MAAIEPAQQTSAETLLDKEQVLVDNLLIRFRNIIELAPVPDERTTKEAAAARSYQMRVETDALIRSGEDLLRLSRQIKELWLGGSLRGLGEEESNGDVDADARAVMGMLGRAMEAVKEGSDQKVSDGEK